MLTSDREGDSIPPVDQVNEGNMFKPLEHRSTVDSVIGTIRDLLLTRRLKPGDRLPNEIELTSRLGTSRGSVREAMKVLSSYGIVDIRRGDGTYISQVASNRVFDHLLFQMLLGETDKRQLMELRELTEIGIIDLVIANAGKDDIACIREAHLRMSERVASQETDSSRLTELDLGFHRAIGAATRNELIRKIYDFTLDLFAPSIKKTHDLPDKGRNALVHHERILEGLEARDRERTEAAVRESIKQWAIRFS